MKRLAPLVITITPNVSAFAAAMERARLDLALFGEAWLRYPAPRERPVDRARRLRLDRIMRARARRARRHGRAPA